MGRATTEDPAPLTLPPSVSASGEIETRAGRDSMQAVAEESDPVASLAAALVPRLIPHLGNGNGNGGKPPPTGLGKVVRSFPAQVLAIIVAGGGSVYATIEATADQSDENADAIDEHDAAIEKNSVIVEELQLGAKQTTEAIERIDETIGGEGGISDTLRTLTDEARKREESRALRRLESKLDDFKEENDELKAKLRDERRRRRGER